MADFHSYKVKIRNNPFTTEDGKQLENMANISFFDENRKELSYLELGYIDTEDIFKLIDEGKDINIDNCYVDNFSLAAYRQSRNIEKEQIVKILSFSANSTYFDTHLNNDFSYAEFKQGPVSFNKAVFLNGDTTFNSSKFGDCDVDFGYAIFKFGNIDFANTVFGEGELSFKNARMGTGTKNFQYAQFGTGKVTFTNAEFGDGDVAFINTDFDHGEVSFKIARFGEGHVDFRFSKFGEGNISFERAEFNSGNVNFSKVDFHGGKITFNRALFGSGDMTFEGATLKNGKLNFISTEFGDGDINLEFLEFDDSDIFLDKAKYGNGKVSFYSSKMKSISMKSSVINNYTDLRVLECDTIDLSGAVIRDLVDLKPHEFPVVVQNLNIIGLCLLGRIYLDWNANHVENLIVTQSKSSNREKSEQFRILKQNFNANGNYDYEDLAYVLFKRYEAKADLEEGLKYRPKEKAKIYVLHFSKWLLYDKMGKFATDPFRVLLSAFYTYVFFSILHYVIPFFYDIPCYNFPTPPANELARLGTTFYYSSITFFTVGYGDIYPFVWPAKIVAAVEPFFGTFMMAYFTVAFARKILR